MGGGTYHGVRLGGGGGGGYDPQPGGLAHHIGPYYHSMCVCWGVGGIWWRRGGLRRGSNVCRRGEVSDDEWQGGSRTAGTAAVLMA